MVFHKGQKVEVYRRSKDDSWEAYMDTLVEVSLEDKGTFRLPQDCLRPLEE